jgi:hypothetical protein
MVPEYHANSWIFSIKINDFVSLKWKSGESHQHLPAAYVPFFKLGIACGITVSKQSSSKIIWNISKALLIFFKYKFSLVQNDSIMRWLDVTIFPLAKLASELDTHLNNKFFIVIIFGWK